MTSLTKRVDHIRCGQCGKPNGPQTLFCDYCRYPLSVINLADFKKSDMIQALAFLQEVTLPTRPTDFKDVRDNQLYSAFWNLYWLRPERVIFRFTEAALLSRLIQKHIYQAPFLDLGCGDGLFTAALWGALPARDRDAYEDLDFAKTDAFSARSTSKVLRYVPHVQGDGVDLKEASVSRAKALGFYRRVFKSDVRHLPCTPRSYRTVFSNMLDDVPGSDIPLVLKEASRVLKPQGMLIFTTPSEHFRENLYFYPESLKSRKRGDFRRARVLETFDRGRSAWEPRARPYWERQLRDAGFRIQSAHSYAGPGVMRFWDTGFRPFFPILVNIKEQLRSGGTLMSVKPLILDMLMSYFRRFVELKPQSKGAFTLVVAQKENPHAH